jgi:hypothetical protein
VLDHHVCGAGGRSWWGSGSLLAGAGARCADPAVPASQPRACAGAFVDASGVARPRVRLAPLLRFDDVPGAALTLFAIGTLDDWPALVRPFAEDGASLLLLIAWLVLAALLWRNLVTAALVDSYLRVSLALEGRQIGDEARHLFLEGVAVVFDLLGADVAAGREDVAVRGDFGGGG